VGLAAGFTFAASPPASAPAGGPTGQVIEGMVLNYMGGGIKDARVRIESPDAPEGASPLAEVLTNQLGEVHVRLPRPAAGPVRVRITKEGYVEVVQEVDPTDETNPPFIDVTLEGTGKLSGRLADHDTGRPIAGARVECANGGRVQTAETGADGGYVFEGIVRGQSQLVFMAEGYGTQREKIVIGEYRVNLNRTLRRQRPIELILSDNEGQPAPDVLVEAFVEPDYDFITAKSDAAGRARLDGVSVQAVAVHLRMNGDRYVRTTEYAKKLEFDDAASQPASAPAAVVRRFALRIGGGVKGKVIDAKTREPIVGVRVIAGREVSSSMPMTWTEADGTYELNGLEPGFNLITFQHGDYAPVVQEVRLSAGQSRPLDAEMAAGLPIEGVVVDAAGKPLDQVRVSAESWKGFTTMGMRTVTDEKGRFSFPNAPPGDITFSFVRPAYGMLDGQVIPAGKRDCRITLAEMERPEPSGGGSAFGRPAKLKVGEPVPDLTLTTTDGKVHKLSDLRGKYVFLDCWASWCGPCIGEIPNVKALRKATEKRPDFVMIGVSLDMDRKAFEQAVEKHGLDWPQAFGPKSGAQETFETLDGVGIPYTCLIGPDGKLIAQDLRGPGLVDEIRKHLPAEGKEVLPPGQDYPEKEMPRIPPRHEVQTRPTGE